MLELYKELAGGVREPTFINVELSSKKSSIYFLGAQKKYLPDFSLGGLDYESGLEVGQDFLTQPNPTYYHCLFFWPNPTQTILTFSEIDPTHFD